MTMETAPNGENKALGTRRSENHPINHSDHPDSLQSSEFNQGFDPGSVRLRDSRADASRQSPLTVTDPFGITANILGGIVTQLIERVESQLGEAIECVDWYERQRGRFQKELDNLKSLAESIKSLQQPSIEQSEEVE